MIVLHGYQTLPPEVIADRESQIEQEFLADQGKYDTEVVQAVEPPADWSADIMHAAYDAQKDRW